MVRFNELDPIKKKNKDRKNREKKIHKATSENRHKVKIMLKRVETGEITEEEFQEAHGEDEID